VADPNGEELAEVVDGVGRDEEWVGFEGASDDLRYDSVRSAMSDVSSWTSGMRAKPSCPAAYLGVDI